MKTHYLNSHGIAKMILFQQTSYFNRNFQYSFVKEKQNFTDVELLGEINKEGADLTMRDLNKGLLHLEIMGLVQVTWMGKNKRRIELVPPKEGR